MHGIVNRALQGFLTKTYGPEIWAEVRSQANLPFDDFEAMLEYPDAMTMVCFHAACGVLHKNPNALLEDIGTWLVTDTDLEPLRRLLRFSGASFLDFINSLEEMADRGRLVMPDLNMPQITVEPLDPYSFRLRMRWSFPGSAPLLLGCLRAMADDYGALALLKLDGFEGQEECLHVRLLDASHSEGRRFELGQVRT